jgi:cyanophycinase-like exopeptidase
LQQPLTVVSFKSKQDAAPEQMNEVAAQIRSANYVFAGPGSPTYAVRNWIDTPIAGAFAAQLRSDGHLVFASSAAIAMSRYVVPVYELYKAGHDPYWVDGLDLLGPYGLGLAIMPHWNNSEGGAAFDTRYCFIGKRRLKAMEDLLPESARMIGLDENTACVIDLAAQTCEIFGSGRVCCGIRDRKSRSRLGRNSAGRNSSSAWFAKKPFAKQRSPVNTGLLVSCVVSAVDWRG